MLLRIPSVATLLLLALLLASCTNCAQPEMMTNDFLYKTWMELHEERSGNVQTYHDPSFTFPIARGREGFTIARGGEFIWHRIAPTDGTMNVPAIWRFEEGSTNVIIVTDPASGVMTRIILLSVGPTTLKARVDS